MQKITIINIVLIILVHFGVSGAVLAEAPIDRAEKAIIKSGSNWAPPGQAKTLEFSFSEGEVSLKENGEWKINGWIRHAGVLCGRYSVGVQFGVGSPGCINVEWVNQPQFSVPKRQCNNAVVKHLVYEKTPELADDFKKITCARRVVRCNGNCKGSSGTFTNQP